MKVKFILSKFIYILLIISIITVIIVKVSRSEKISLHETDDLESLPVVTVEHIEKSDYSSDNKFFSRYNYGHYENILYKDWNLLIPMEYTLTELITLNDQNGDHTKSDLFLTVDYYLARFDFIAEGLAEDILYRETNRNPLSPIILQDEDKSRVVYGAESEKAIILLCRYGRQVLYLRYSNGTVSMEKLAKIVLDKMESNEKLQNYN